MLKESDRVLSKEKCPTSENPFFYINDHGQRKFHRRTAENQIFSSVLLYIKQPKGFFQYPENGNVRHQFLLI